MKRTMRRLATIMILVAATMMVTVGCGCSRKEEPKQVTEEPKTSAPEKVVEEKEENFELKFSEENQQTIFDFYIEEDKVFFEPEVEILGEDGEIALDKEPTKTVYRWSWTDWKKSKEMILEERIEQLTETVDRVDIKKEGVYLLRYEFEEQKLDVTVYVHSKAEEDATNESALNSTNKEAITPKVPEISNDSKSKLDSKTKANKKSSKKEKSSKKKPETKKPTTSDPTDNPSGEDEADKKADTYVADVSNIKYLGTEVTYDKGSHAVTVDKSTFPQGIVNVVVQNQKGGYTNAGTYEIPVKYSVKSNYKPIPDGVVRLTIKPKSITPDCKVTGTTVDYDKNAHSVSVVESSVSEGATFVRAENNSRTDAGTQDVTLVFARASTNYTLTTSRKIVKLTVNQVDLPGSEEIVFESKYFKYYNTEYSIEATNVPSDITVSYSGNGQKEKGKWPVKAYFHVGPNYKPIPAKVAYIIITDSGDPSDGEPQPPKEDEEEEPELPVKPGPGGVEEAGPTNSPTPTTPKEPNASQEAATPTEQPKSTTSKEPSSYKAVAEVTPEQSKDVQNSSDEKNDADKKTEDSTNVEPKQEEKKAETKKEPQKAPKETTEAAEAPKEEEPKKVDPPKEEKKEETKKQEPPVKEETKKASDSGQEESAEKAE